MAAESYDFWHDCEVIKLESEYDGYTGEERYAIITDLSKSELHKRYSSELKQLKPYVVLTREMGQAIKDMDQNEDKFLHRYLRGDIYITCCDRDEATIQALTVEDEQTKQEKSWAMQRLEEIYTKALESATPQQRRHWLLHFINGLSFQEIAEQEGKSVPTIFFSCKNANDLVTKAIMEVNL